MKYFQFHWDYFLWTYENFVTWDKTFFYKNEIFVIHLRGLFLMLRRLITWEQDFLMKMIYLLRLFFVTLRELHCRSARISWISKVVFFPKKPDYFSLLKSEAFRLGKFPIRKVSEMWGKIETVEFAQYGLRVVIRWIFHSYWKIPSKCKCSKTFSFTGIPWVFHAKCLYFSWKNDILRYRAAIWPLARPFAKSPFRRPTAQPTVHLTVSRFEIYK